MEMIVFLTTATIAVLGGLGMLISRNAVHSALFLLVNFGAIAVIFLLLASPFLAMLQLTVYAGAIMVLFLFVVMLLGAEQVEDQPDRIEWQRGAALGMGVVLLVQALIVTFVTGSTLPVSETPELLVISDPATLGVALFTTYLLPLEVVGVLLLVAIVGVVVIKERSRTQPGTETAAETATATVTAATGATPSREQPAPTPSPTPQPLAPATRSE